MDTLKQILNQSVTQKIAGSDPFYRNQIQSAQAMNNPIPPPPPMPPPPMPPPSEEPPSVTANIKSQSYGPPSEIDTIRELNGYPDNYDFKANGLSSNPGIIVKKTPEGKPVMEKLTYKIGNTVYSKTLLPIELQRPNGKTVPSKIDAKTYESLMTLAEDFKRMTGKNLVINEVYRSPGASNMARKKKGNVVAPGGTSGHGYGTSLDINQNELVRYKMYDPKTGLLRDFIVPQWKLLAMLVREKYPDWRWLGQSKKGENQHFDYMPSYNEAPIGAARQWINKGNRVSNPGIEQYGL